jgi:hypothetical protein
MNALRWLRRHLVPTAAVIAVAAGVAAGLTVLLTGGKTTHSPVGTPAAAAQQADSTTKGSSWLAGSDGRRLTAVTADLGRINVAEHAGRQRAAANAGARLAADAAAALAGAMPPADAAEYRSALSDLRAAGAAAAAGHFGQQAARMLLAGETGIMRVTAAADMPVAGKAPAIPAAPAGRP